VHIVIITTGHGHILRLPKIRQPQEV